MRDDSRNEQSWQFGPMVSHPCTHQTLRFIGYHQLARDIGGQRNKRFVLAHHLPQALFRRVLPIATASQRFVAIAAQ